MAGQTVYGLVLGYDNVGRISTKTEVVSGASHVFDYTYDVDGQLFEVRKDGILVEQYGYDNNANRTSTLTTTASYDDQDRLIQRGGVNYTFDADRFLTSRGSDTFAYSARGELLSATVGGQTVTYQYDGMARRIGKTDAGGTTQYLYGNPGNPFQMTASRDAVGVVTTIYYDTPGNLYAFERGGARYYVATDHLGTPKAVTHATGAVVKSVEYDTWGVMVSDTNPGFDLPVGFAGGVGDGAIGLVRFGFRDYEPGTGRWTAKDPILFKSGEGNLYTYSGNSTVNNVDANGLTWTENMNLLLRWLSGSGPDHVYFGPGSKQAKDMMNAPGVVKAREYYYRKRGNPSCGGNGANTEVTNYDARFGAEGYLRAGFNSTQQFVGRYRIDIYPYGNNQIMFILSNTTSFKSLPNGLGPEWERSDFGPGGNMKQTIYWAEPLR